MKKGFLYLSGLMLVAVMLVSCNKNSPKDVALAWATCIKHMDYDGAKKYSTEDTKSMLNLLQQFAGKMSEDEKKKAQAINVTIKDVKEEGDKATVTYISSDDPQKQEVNVKLVKQNGQWLVQFSKNDAAAGPDASGSTDKTMSDTPPPPPVATDSTVPDTSHHEAQ